MTIGKTGIDFPQIMGCISKSGAAQGAGVRIEDIPWGLRACILADRIRKNNGLGWDGILAVEGSCGNIASLKNPDGIPAQIDRCGCHPDHAIAISHSQLIGRKILEFCSQGGAEKGFLVCQIIFILHDVIPVYRL